MFKKTILLIAIFYLNIISVECYSQTNSSDVYFKHLTPNTGLPFSTVHDMLQDDAGFMWFATSSGLFRYDGNNFKAFQNIPFDSTSIIDNSAYRLCKLSNGKILVGLLNEGIAVYNPIDESIENLKYNIEHSENIGSNVKAIFEDSKKRVWIGSEDKGLLLFDKDNYTVTKYSEKTDALSNNITAITEDKSGRIWVCDTLGITQLFPEKEDAKRYNTQSNFFYENVSGWDKKMFVDSKGEIWIASHRSGLYRFNPDTKIFQRYFQDANNENSLINDNVVCISESNDSIIWVGVDGGGISLFDRKRNTFQKVLSNPDISSSLLNNSVYSIYKDKSGAIWVGTYMSGLNVFDPKKPKFNSYTYESKNKNSLSGEHVLCVYQDSNEKIWVGTDGYGLNLFNPELKGFKRFRAQQHEDALHCDVIKTICEVKPGVLWLGTYQGGIEILDTETYRFEHLSANYFDPHKISAWSIWSISETKEGNLWLAMLGRPINFYNKEKNIFVKYEYNQKGLKTNTTLSSIVDSENRAWFGSKFGLILYDEKLDTFLTFDKYNGLGSNDITTIFEDSKKRLWVGTNGGGLNYFDFNEKRFTAYTEKEGLPSNTIYSILEDDNGIFWLSTNTGICSFKVDSLKVKSYDETDGLPGNKFVNDCAMKSSTGYMYFGSINGLVEFHPDSIIADSYVPPVYISDILLFNKRVAPGDGTQILSKSISHTEEIILNHNQTVITLVFSTIGFRNQKKNQYAYQLVGFDKEWNHIGNKKEVTYTNLGAGEYVFNVKTSNSDGIWNPEVKTLNIKVLPPVWKRWYMYFLYFVMFAGLILYLRKLTLARERYKNQVQIEYLKNEKIKELNQEKLKFFTGISHEFRTPLTLIIDPIDKLMHSKDVSRRNLNRLLKLMHQNANRLLNLVNQLIYFRVLEEGKVRFNPTENNLVEFVKNVSKSFSFTAKERGIKFTLKLPDIPFNISFDKEKLDNMIFNLLSNAFRYTQDNGEITLKVEKVNYSEIRKSPLDDDIPPGLYALISVKDNGVGISKDKLDNLFERFSQTTDNVSFGIKGTGIGLSLVKEYVKLHNGIVYVESIENVGTKFTVLLPISEDQVETETTFQQSKELIFNVSDESIDDEEVEKVPPKQEQKDTPIVLVVEDNRDLREYVKGELSNHFIVKAAENGLEGFNLAKEVVPDIIVSDIMMPEMDGIEMCRKVKFNESTSHIPVVLLTAKSGNESKEEGFSGGADVYVTKPFSIKVLLACIKNQLVQRKKLRELFNQNFISETKVQTTNELDEKFFEKMNNYILKNLDNFDFNTDMLASEMAVSRTGLFRKIKALTGQSASIYVRNFRLKKAAEMLQEKKLPVSDIALLTGFRQLSYFTKCFKEQYNKTPSDFMNS